MSRRARTLDGFEESDTPYGPPELADKPQVKTG
jgi:hypothetical protein